MAPLLRSEMGKSKHRLVTGHFTAVEGENPVQIPPSRLRKLADPRFHLRDVMQASWQELLVQRSQCLFINHADIAQDCDDAL
jgi:hypothetical protein